MAATVNIEAPQVLATQPMGASPGQTVALRLDGVNFGGTSSIQFLTPLGTADPNVVVSGLALNGSTLTANIAVAQNSQSEEDTIVVTTDGGSSTPSPLDGENTFTILPASNVLSLGAAPVQGASTIQGTLLLTGSVPTGGGTVTLTSSDPSVTVPVSVSANYGYDSVTFPITTSEVQTQTSVTITATYNGTSASASLTETP